MKTSAVLAGSILVAAAAYSGAAWYVGMEAENTIRAAVERANHRIIKTLGPDAGSVGATVSIDDYQRGIFSSRARYTFVLQDGSERSEISLVDNMQHGPFPWGLVSQGVFDPQLAWSRSELVDTQSVKRWFDAARGAMPLQADTRIGFGGKGQTEWRLAPLEWVGEGEQLSFSGGQVRVVFSNGFRDSDALGEFESLVLGEVDGDSVVLKKIALQSGTRSQADDTVKVDSVVNVAAMVIDAAATESVVLERVSVVLDSTQKGALLDAALGYEVGQLRVGEAGLGSLKLGGRVERFNFEAFSGLIAEYDAIAAEHDAPEGEDFDLTPEDETRLLARLVQVLASSPALALEPVSWSNEQGVSSLALKMDFRPLPPGDARVQQEALTQALRELRLNVEVSRAMLMQAVATAAGGGEDAQEFQLFAGMLFDSYIAQLEQQGVVRVEDGRARLALVYKNGQIELNGETMPMEEFLGLMGEMGL